ncbi:HAD family hydrolase [Pseudobacteriovorax antillogorgiicola]|uniref:Putative hydrolase of the HAD superfamily n=1 Tax=Pseudobacteriovorax antillogorgiicola TaxID=1513793 RepID=A0A1Y6CNA0_9BACT|nr:HAD family phosphatase [Pseudobacteriovorax antillogorgiicola]TCS47228.1 putative hydrolase of the HAD superfamily [Pseudobacteriovorax antillogorgiicola]SMF61917.1 putative hydrolase of the HAD superfamily [Pseudobacteriovorax antillogorgiicola]
MTNYQNYKNIIFDFGGVLLEIDYRKTEDAFCELMGDGSHAGFSQASQSDLFNLIEVGAISNDAFRQGLRDLFQKSDVSDRELDLAWNALLGTIPRDWFEHVKAVGETRRIFLLSNTNAIHLDEVYREMERSLGSVEAFESAFEKVYYSHRLGLRKPHREIFETVIQENQLDPKDTLFIDDSIQHIQGAKELGLGTHHLTGLITDLQFL